MHVRVDYENNKNENKVGYFFAELVALFSSHNGLLDFLFNNK